MASLKIEPLCLEDLDEHIRVYWASFSPPEADMVAPMIYPNGLTPELFERLRQRHMREYDGNFGELCFSAKDTETGAIVAVSRWGIKDRPQSREEVDADFEKAKKNRNAGPPIEGMNHALNEAFLPALLYSEYETMQGRAHVTLKLLATHPDHQRRGAGSLLLRHGLAKFAEPLQLPVYLDASKGGRPLYERFGFEVKGEVPFDGRKYGGRSQAQHWCMVRPAQLTQIESKN